MKPVIFILSMTLASSVVNAAPSNNGPELGEKKPFLTVGATQRIRVFAPRGSKPVDVNAATGDVKLQLGVHYTPEPQDADQLMFVAQAFVDPHFLSKVDQPVLGSAASLDLTSRCYGCGSRATMKGVSIQMSLHPGDLEFVSQHTVHIVLMARGRQNKPWTLIDQARVSIGELMGLQPISAYDLEDVKRLLEGPLHQVEKLYDGSVQVTYPLVEKNGKRYLLSENPRQSADGACKALGYEKASSRAGFGTTAWPFAALLINADGIPAEVIGADGSEDSESDAYVIQHLYCR